MSSGYIITSKMSDFSFQKANKVRLQVLHQSTGLDDDERKALHHCYSYYTGNFSDTSSYSKAENFSW